LGRAVTVFLGFVRTLVYALATIAGGVIAAVSAR
jgi:hypothetical protein